jgi:hypothetical protein
MESNVDLQLIAARFPHIARALTLLWGEPEVVTYVDKLFLDTRGGTRRGFPADVRNALIAIRGRHQSAARETPFMVRGTTSHWGSGGRRERW